MQELLDLAKAGPVAILLVGIVALARAFLTGAVVPGWVYKRERERSDKLEAENVELVRNQRDLARAAANAKVNGSPGG